MMVKTCLFNALFQLFRNHLWRHLISYNSFRNVNMCLLEVAICEKCWSSHFQSEAEVKILGLGGATDWGEGLLLLRGQYPITWHGQPLILGAVVKRCPGSLCLEVNCQTYNFTLQAFLSILVTSFWPALKNY